MGFNRDYYYISESKDALSSSSAGEEPCTKMTRWLFCVISPYCSAFDGGTISLSADPGLGQGRGGAWDHRRCGTSPSSLSTVKPILQPSSHINSFCRLPALKPSQLHPAANSHPAPHINRFFWPLLHPTATPRPHINGFLWASKSAVCQPLNASNPPNP